MSAGLPGVGLGAFLYLLLVLFLPVRALLFQRASRDWPVIWRQVIIVGLMVGVAAVETEFALWLGFLPASRLVRSVPVFLLGAVVFALEIVRAITWFRLRKTS